MDLSDNNKELWQIFQIETEEIMERIFDSLFSLEQDLKNKEIIGSMYRDLHSLKGAMRMIGLNNLQTIIHKMEDIFDAVIQNKYILEINIVKLMIHITNQVEKFLKESIINTREIITDEYATIIFNLDFIIETEITAEKNKAIFNLSDDNNDISTINIEQLEQNINSNINENLKQENKNKKSNHDFIQKNKEFVNNSFNISFELIDSIVPEEETSDIVLLEEEIQKIYEIIKETELYEIKISLENIITKINLVRQGSNILTISEILEIRNELSSAVAKFSTSCIATNESDNITFFDVAKKISMLQGSCVYSKEIKEDILSLKNNIEDNNILEIINIIIDILDFLSENSIQLEEQMTLTLKTTIEYCGYPNEGVDNDLILQQLEIMKQLLELNYKKEEDVNVIKNISTQVKTNNTNNSSNNEIKTLHVNAQKLDLLVNQLGELIITKIKTEKNLEKIDSIKNANEICQKELLKTSNFLRYYNRKYLQFNGEDQYTNVFTRQVFSLLSNLTQNVARTIYDLSSLYRTTKEDDIKMRLIIDEMESMVKNIRVLPISTVFNSFSRMVRDIATEKGKDIDFEIYGKDTCADKKIIEEIKTPLIHILRNAIDHGIESKNERLNRGKSPTGKITLSAKQDDNKVIIEVVDDGQGFNLEKIKERAVSRGFLTKEDIENMTDESIMNIIFWPGFTTGDSITSISGRGIGLDVVKTKISQLNGKVKVLSEFGKGSCVRIEIPVTLTTLRVFLVKISNQIFAIPIQMITTFILKKQSEIKNNNGGYSILYNNNVIPLYYLSDILELEQNPRGEKETILIIESDEKMIGLVVDRLLGDQDVLQKKLSPPLYKVKNISGITNLASGELCLILNMQDILHHDFNKAISMAKPPLLLAKDIASYKRILVVDDSITTRTMIKNILLNIGYVVDVALDVDEALVKLKLNHFDLIITDIIMPKVNGIEFIEKLKNDEMYSDIPIIVISSVKEDELKSMEYNSNYVDFYIAKDSFQQIEFSEQVAKILSKYHI